MAKEIEYKYLVVNTEYRLMASEKHHIMQGYLSREPESTIRIRIKDDKGFLTIKGITHHAIRDEYEYEIPLSDALQMLDMCKGRVIDKTRYIVVYKGHTWEVDEFGADLAPLTIAEIEISDITESYEIPPFVGMDVTGDPKYYNSNL